MSIVRFRVEITLTVGHEQVEVRIPRTLYTPRRGWWYRYGDVLRVINRPIAQDSEDVETVIMCNAADQRALNAFDKLVGPSMAWFRRHLLSELVNATNGGNVTPTVIQTHKFGHDLADSIDALLREDYRRNQRPKYYRVHYVPADN